MAHDPASGDQSGPNVSGPPARNAPQGPPPAEAHRPPGPAWAAPHQGPPPAPHTSPAAVRKPVMLVGAVAVISVLGLFAWDGGDVSDGGAGPGAPGGFVVPGGGGNGQTASPSVGGSSSSSGSGSSSSGSGSYQATTVAPLVPTQLQPPLSAPTAPTETMAQFAWRSDLRVSAVLDFYQQNFPASGYALGDPRISSGDVTIAWDVIPDAEGPQVGIGQLYIQPDPANPASTIVEYVQR